ncbi:MAG: DUF6807 family protein [Planctomycetota bacterium]
MRNTFFGGMTMSVFACGAAPAVFCLVALGAACVGGAESQLQINTGAEAITVKDGERLVLEYCFDQVPFKPYARQVLSPNGVNVARDQVADHKHHHGLMFAIGAEGTTFWEEKPKDGKELHKSFSDVKTVAKDGLAVATFTEQLDWIGPEAKAVLQEVRRVDAYRGADLAASLLTWRTALAAAEGRPEVKLTGANYYGLGIRFLASMDKIGEFFAAAGQANGEAVRAEERLTGPAWCAYAAEADGKPVTVAMFDHPQNARKVSWFTMSTPFAYLSATLALHKEPLAVKAGQPLALCYGVAVWDGKVKAEEIEKLYHRWLELEKAK